MGSKEMSLDDNENSFPPFLRKFLRILPVITQVLFSYHTAEKYYILKWQSWSINQLISFSRYTFHWTDEALNSFFSTTKKPHKSILSHLNAASMCIIPYLLIQIWPIFHIPLMTKASSDGKCSSFEQQRQK